MRRMSIASVIILVVLIMSVTTRSALADNTANSTTHSGNTGEPDYGKWFGGDNSRFTIQLGTFSPTFSSDIRVDSDTDEGSDIDLEDTAGLENNETVFRADALWRIGRKQQLGFTYFSNDRSVLWTLQEDEQVGDTTFPAGTGVNLDFDTEYFLLKYLYSFKQSDKLDMAASIGVHTFRFDFSMQSTTGDLSEAADATAPLPMLGFYVDYYPSPRWRIYGIAEALDLSIGDYSGSFTDLGAGVEYAVAKNYGIGLGFDRFTTSVDASASDFSGHLEYRYRGFQLFATGRF